MSPDYRRLIDLSELALALAEGGELDSLAIVDAHLEKLATALPSPPQPSARRHLERAAALQAARTAALSRARDTTVVSIRKLAAGRRTARCYAPATPAVHLVDQAG